MPSIEVYRVSVPVEVDDKTTPTVERLEKAFDALDRRVVRPRVDARDVQHGHETAGALHTALDRLSRTNVRVRLSLLDNATGPLRSILSLVGGPLGIAGGGALLGASIAWPLKLAGNLEQTLISYKSFLGSQEQAISFQKQMEKLADISPFHTATLERDAVGLLNVSRNAAFTMRALTAFGDAASTAGVSEERMSLALLGFTQIAGRGTLQMQEMDQILQNVPISAQEMQRELGISAQQWGDLGNQGISASRAMEAVLRVMERAPYAGGMALQAKTLNGLLSTLGDTGTRAVRSFGVGMAEELVPRLQSMVGWTDKNAESVGAFNQSLTELGRAIMGGPLSFLEARMGDFNRMITTEMWREGTGGERAQLFWKRVITDPFDAWWLNGGEKKVQDISGKVGGSLGGFLGGALAGAVGAGRDSKLDDPFLNAGKVAGEAFTKAFVDAFDPSRLWAKLVEFNRTQSPFRSIFSAELNQGLDLVPGLGQARGEARALVGAGGRTATPSAWTGGEPLTRDQFNDPAQLQHFIAAGLDANALANACGPIVAAGLARAVGVAADPAEIAKQAEAAGVWSRTAGVLDRANGLNRMLAMAGVTGSDLTQTQMMDRLQHGRAIGINAAAHYYEASGIDEQGRLIVGSTGTSRKGGSERMSLADITRLEGGDLRYVGVDRPGAASASASGGLPYGSYDPNSPGGRALSMADTYAQGNGYTLEERKAIRAVLLQEGGAAGNLNPSSGAAGLWQLYGTENSPGELNSFARARGLSLEAARAWAQEHPEDTTAYALGEGGYMRKAVMDARLRNLRGAALAEDLQRYGQRSESPELAAKRYTELYGSRGYATGGVITEPVWGVGKSGQGYSFGENGPERITPLGQSGGGGNSITISGPVSFSIPLTIPSADAAEVARAAKTLAPRIIEELTHYIGRGRSNVALGVSGT